MGYLSDLREKINDTIEYHFDVLTERLMDAVHKIRRPLMIFAGMFVLMTIRSARKRLRKSGYSGSSYSSYAKDLPYYNPTKSTSSSSYGSSSYGTGSSYGGSSFGSSGFGSGSTYGSGSSYGSSGFGSGSSYGSSGSNFGGSMDIGSGSSSYGGFGSGSTGFGSSSSSGSGMSTADIVDTYASSVAVLATLFQDYGAVKSFSGPVETLSCFESMSAVEMVVREQGNGRVLVIDGGGSTKASILSGEMVYTAKMNGWKGIIVNGSIRGSHKISTIDIGVMALGTCPTKGTSSRMGKRRESVTFGGVQFVPGSWVYADSDGVVVSESQLNSFGGYGGTGSSFGSGSSSFGGSSSTDPFGGSSFGSSGSSFGGSSSTDPFGSSGSSFGSTSSTDPFGSSGSSFGGTSSTDPFGSSSTFGGGGNFGGTSSTDPFGSSSTFGSGGNFGGTSSTDPFGYSSTFGGGGDFGSSSTTGTTGTSSTFSDPFSSSFGSSTGFGFRGRRQ